jgi:ABC-2 type transport system permease protein
MQWLLLVILPVLVSLFVIALFGARTPIHTPVGVVIQDESHLTRKILRSLKSNADINVKRICSDASACESAMRAGELLAVIHLPPELEKRARRGEAPVIPVYLSGQSLITYNTLYKEIQTVIGSISADLDRRNLPDPISVQLHAVHNPVMDYQVFLGLGLIAAVFHLGAMVVAIFLAAEPLREHNADKLLKAAGGSPWIAFAGRFLPALLILWLLMLAFNVCIRFHAGIRLDIADFALLSAGILGMLAACIAAGMAWVGISGTMRIASSAAGAIGSPAFAFSGLTFPLEAMPWAVQIFANLLPLTHFLELQTQIMFGSAGREAAFSSLLILCGMTLFWLLVGIFPMIHRWKNPHFHGGRPEELPA